MICTVVLCLSLIFFTNGSFIQKQICADDKKCQKCEPIEQCKLEDVEICIEVPKVCEDVELVPRKVCVDLPEMKCEDVLKEVCDEIPKTDEVCSLGDFEVCNQVPKEVCEDKFELVPRKVCVDTPKMVCTDVPKDGCKEGTGLNNEVCNLEDFEVCSVVPTKVCKDVNQLDCELTQEERCHNVPKMICKPVEVECEIEFVRECNEELEPTCHTEFDNVNKPECSLSFEDQCHTVPKMVCNPVVIDPKCETVVEKECAVELVSTCHTEFDEVKTQNCGSTKMCHSVPKMVCKQESACP